MVSLVDLGSCSAVFLLLATSFAQPADALLLRLLAVSQRNFIIGRYWPNPGAILLALK